MIEGAFGAVVEAHLNAIALRYRRGDHLTEVHRYVFKPFHEPTSAGRTDGSLAKPVLNRTRKTANEIRPSDNLADTGGTDVGWCV